MLLRIGVLKICSKFAGEHPCRSVISTKLIRNFIEMTLRHGCFSVNLLNNFRISFDKNTSEWLLLNITSKFQKSQVFKVLLSCLNLSANIMFGH